MENNKLGDYVKLPETDWYWNDHGKYIEHTPDSDYSQASEENREAFRDMKYGVRIHWGLYSLLKLDKESWPFLEMTNEKKKEYGNLYKKFYPKEFDAEKWMELFEKAGAKCFAFTTKHHEGFSLFDTKTRVKQRVDWGAEGGPVIEDCDVAFSVMETPFGRDIVKELCDEAHKRNIKIDLYFSHPDWYDADFRPYCVHPLTTPEQGDMTWNGERDLVGSVMGPSVTDEQEKRMMERHRNQLIELLTNYGKIDMLCLDTWLGWKVWPQLRETIKTIRRIQPNVMMRARGIGNYGDYYTPENFVPESKENTTMPWMSIHPLATSFSYDDDVSKYKGAQWIVHSLVDAVAKGGNFMVGIGPDENGNFHPKAVEALIDAGTWLEVNGEAIYATRPREGELYKEGDFIRYTRSKEEKTVYAICLEWPGDTLLLKTVKPRENSPVTMLGYNEPLNWNYSEKNGLVIQLPEKGTKEYAYSFKFEVLGV